MLNKTNYPKNKILHTKSMEYFIFLWYSIIETELEELN